MSAYGPSRPKPNLQTMSALRSRADLPATRAYGGSNIRAHRCTLHGYNR